MGCAPTQRGPTFAPGVRLVTGCLKTSRGVKVKTVQLFPAVLVIQPKSLALLWLLKAYSTRLSSLSFPCKIDFPSKLHFLYVRNLYTDIHGVFFPDIDECQSLSTCVNGICLNSEGSYTCENCPTGYRVSFDGELCEGWLIENYSVNGAFSYFWVCCCENIAICQWMSKSPYCFLTDIDECALPTACPQGTCTNREGSFTCVVCEPGFRVSEDGQRCDGESLWWNVLAYVCMLESRCV